MKNKQPDSVSGEGSREPYLTGMAIIAAAIIVSLVLFFSAAMVQEGIANFGAKAANQGSPAVPQPPAPAASGTPKMYVLSDARCAECDTTQLVSNLKVLFNGSVDVTTLDYGTAEGKAIYAKAGAKLLPAVLFEESVKNSAAYGQLANYLDAAGDYYSLRVGGFFDPKGEICGNGIDDDNNGKKDCEDAACSAEAACMQKLAKPSVELFVMSHCPYGTQIEKGVLPVIDLLGNKVDWNVRFVYYAMHGEKEVREEQLQYCMQKENKSAYFGYLACFLDKGNTTDCLSKMGKTTDSYKACMDQADAEFNITKNFNDKASYLSGTYPLFSTDAVLNKKYNVGGSPTVVINGAVVEIYPRDPASVLKAVCQGFAAQPAECSQNLSSEQYSPGFGFTFTQAAGGIATCGT